jgi:L-ascorbate metabolism protein UlaG (beta-lactamase superfamily)
METFEEFIRIVRLSWAGLQITAADFTIAIDPLENIPTGAGVSGKPRTKAFVCTRALDAVLITHLRDDHYDARSLKQRLKPSGKVICSLANVDVVRTDGFQVDGLALYEVRKVGPFSVAAAPAVDGLGSDQISFLVELDGVKILHCGDTLWHGHWWKFATQFGPIDVAFMPVNGALVEISGAVSTGVPVTLTPIQAAAAADVMCAKLACPMHYGMFDHPPGFREWPNAVDIFMEEASRRNLVARRLEPGEEMLLDRVPPSAD